MLTNQPPDGFEPFTPRKDELLTYPLFLGGAEINGQKQWLLIESPDEFMDFLTYAYTFARPIEGSYLESELNKGKRLSDILSATEKARAQTWFTKTPSIEEQ